MKNLKISDETHNKLKIFCNVNNFKINEWVDTKILELIKNNIYVEITPRQSGKTTRLVKNVKKFLTTNSNNDKIIPVVVTVKNTMSKNIKGMLSDYGVDVNRVIFSNTMFINGKSDYKYKFFVDEFDFIERSKLFICENSYYCTTMKNSEGDDFSKQLYNTFLNSILWKN